MNAQINGNGRHAPAFPDRMPPWNEQAEEGLLGSVLLDPAVMTDVCDAVDPDDFFRESHATFWAEMRAMDAEGVPCDVVLLAERLGLKGLMPRDEAVELLLRLREGVPHAISAKYYADIVRQKAVGRKLAGAANETLRDVYSNNFTAESLLDSAERRVLAVADSGVTGDTVRIDAVMPAVMDAIARRSEGEVTGIPSGLADLDDVTTGFQPENLIYLAGRTSTGKTSLAVNIVDHVATNLGLPVLMVSLEMSRTEIGERLIVARSGVDGHKVRSGVNLGPAEIRKLAEADAEIRKAPIFIDHTSGRTAAQIVANARRYHKREGVKLVVIDLINHVAGAGGRDESRREQMCLISLRFKGLARELKVPVIVLAQLNRGPDNREGNRPRKSDLKECGNLEEDADLVMLLYRPEYYDPNDSPGQAVVIVDKNRNGPTRDVRVAFQKHIMRFDNLYPYAAAEPPLEAPDF